LKNKINSQPKTVGLFKFFAQIIAIIIIAITAGSYIGSMSEDPYGLIIGALVGAMAGGILCILNSLRLTKVK